jgi:hypothetical protein
MTTEPTRGLDGFLPGLLLGARVTMGPSVGTILKTGHWYGPGAGHDQAYVAFDPTWQPGDPAAEHPLKRSGEWHGEESWYYLSELDLAPESRSRMPSW